MTSSLGVTTSVESWRDRQRQSGHLVRHTMSYAQVLDLLLSFAVALALIRGARLWYGWPTSQNEFVSKVEIHEQFMLLVPLAISLVYALFRWDTIKDYIRKPGIATLIFLFFLLYSVLASVDLVKSARGLLAVAALSIPALLYRWRFQSVATLIFVQKVACAIIVVNIVYIVLFPHYAYMSGSLEGDMRGMFPHKNGFGHTMAAFTIFLLPVAGEFRRPSSWTFTKLFCFAVACLFVVTSHSSTAVFQVIVGISAAVGAAFIGNIPKYSVRGLLAISIFALLLVAALFAGTGILGSLVGAVGKDMTFSGRSYIWAALIPHIFDYPMSGHGFSMFRDPSYTAYFLRNVPFSINSPHSTYIELLLNIGIPGGIAWFTVVLSRVYLKMVRVADSAEQAIAKRREIAIIVMTLVGSATESGQMLGPIDALSIFLLVLPMDRPWRPAPSTRQAADR